jgi:selenocysteine lyase/cysteine desulfurase
MTLNISKNTDMLTCQKNLFSLPEEICYLNCATMSPLLKSVSQAGIMGINQKELPFQITQETFFETTQPVKIRFAQLINADSPERISLIPSVSYGMAIVAKNLRARAGQEILMVQDEFPSGVYAWEEVCREKNLRIRVVEAPRQVENRGQKWNENLLEQITSDTCLLVLSPVHWADGTLFDLVTLSQRCREVGAAFVLDGTQSIGAYPFDCQKVRPDAVITGGYKWLLGPYSSGVAYWGPYFDNGSPIEFNWINRVGSEDFSQLIHYQTEMRPLADRYNMGERSNFILNPMLAEALNQLFTWGVESIQQYCQNLLSMQVTQWQRAGYWVETEGFRSSHLFGIRLPDSVDITQLKEILKKEQVFISFRGDSIRISPHVYNEQKDIQKLSDILLYLAS